MVHRTNHSTAPCIMCIGFFGVLFLILSIFGAIIPLIDFYNLEQDQCNVTKVEYPTSLPTEGDTSNWVECDCGRHCMSWSPCIKIYADDDNTNYVLEDIYSSSFENCTFYDDYCLESEDVVVLQEQLRLSIAKAESYINSTIPCFFNQYSNHYYISNYLNEPAVYFYLIITGILFIVISILCFDYCKSKKKNTNNTTIDDEVVEKGEIVYGQMTL